MQSIREKNYTIADLLPKGIEFEELPSFQNVFDNSFDSLSLGGGGISEQTFTHDLVFSSTDLDTVAWSSGTITLANGRAFVIASGNTGNISAQNFIYFDFKVSTNILQKSTVATDAIGTNRLLIAIVENGVSNATFQVFTGQGGIKVQMADVENAGALASKNAVDLATSEVTNKTGANITYTSGGVTLDSLKPAEASADKTSNNTAASITGQGALATLSTADFATKVSGTEKPENNATVGATAGTDLKDSGAVVLADREVKNIVSLTSGATINGATLPVPVYMNTSDNRVYAGDGNVSTAIRLIGFAISNATAGNSIKVQLIGNVGGFSGLSIGSTYYLQDAVGTIGLVSGTYKVQVGVAISATEIWIKLEDEGTTFSLIASDTLKASADTERSLYSSTPAKKKEIKTKYQGVIRVKFDLKEDQDQGGSAQGQIYKNGSAFGTLQSTDSATYVNFSEDLSFSEDDLIQLYINNTAGGGAGAICRNFRLYWDKVTSNDYIVNTD